MRNSGNVIVKCMLSACHGAGVVVAMLTLGSRGAIAFDCSKASLPADFVICSSPESMEANDELTVMWRTVRANQDESAKKALLDEQRAWMKGYGPKCGLPGKGRPSPEAIANARPCVIEAIQARTLAISQWPMSSTPVSSAGSGGKQVDCALASLPDGCEIVETHDTPKGSLTIVRSGSDSDMLARILLGNQIIGSAEDVNVALYDQTPANPVALFAMSSGGNACDATFILVDVRPTRPYVSEEFGNCARPRVENHGDMMRIVFPAGGAGSETWEYRLGTLRQVAKGPADQAIWQTTDTSGDGPRQTLSIRDKWGQLGSYKATFVVKDAGGKRWRRTMSVEGNLSADCVFPDDFNTPYAAGPYTYEIIVNDEVVLDGRFALTAAAPSDVTAMAAEPAMPIMAPTASNSDAPKISGGQEAFIAAVKQAREAFRAAGNELARGGTRPARGRAICSVLPSRRVSNWVGKIKRIDSTNDGKGVVEISLGDDIIVKTWDNAFSDLADSTLIEPGSALFRVAETLVIGDPIVFSGEFLASDVDCVEEGSVTLAGSMRQPEFIFLFQELRKK